MNCLPGSPAQFLLFLTERVRACTKIERSWWANVQSHTLFLAYCLSSTAWAQCGTWEIKSRLNDSFFFFLPLQAEKGLHFVGKPTYAVLFMKTGKKKILQFYIYLFLFFPSFFSIEIKFSSIRFPTIHGEITSMLMTWGCKENDVKEN